MCVCVCVGGLFWEMNTVIIYCVIYRNQSTFNCPVCGEENIVENCFRDRAVEYELRNSTLKCLNPSCPWEGESRFYQVCLELYP